MFGSDECPEEIIMEQQESTSGTVGAKRQKNQRGMKPKKTTQDKRMEELQATTLPNIRQFLEKTMNQEMNPENAINLCGIILEAGESDPLPLMTVIFLISMYCPTHLDLLLHPMKWKRFDIQNFWTENLTIIPTTAMQSLLDQTRKNLKTAYSNTPVRSIQKIFQDCADINPMSLYPLDLMELITAFENLNNLLSSTPHGISTSSALMRTTYTLDTSAPIETNLVGAVGSKNLSFSPDTNNVDFVGLLERPSFSHQTMETFCDTYVKAADASRELVASTTLKDYLIDINIYRLVLIDYMYEQHKIFHLQQNLSINFIKKEKKIKHTFDWTVDLKYKILDSMLYKNIKRVFNLKSDTTIMVVCLEMLSGDNTNNFNRFKNIIDNFFYHNTRPIMRTFNFDFVNYNCKICSFVHTYKYINNKSKCKKNMFKQIKKTYSLIPDSRINDIVNHCYDEKVNLMCLSDISFSESD